MTDAYRQTITLMEQNPLFSVLLILMTGLIAVISYIYFGYKRQQVNPTPPPDTIQGILAKITQVYNPVVDLLNRSLQAAETQNDLLEKSMEQRTAEFDRLAANLAQYREQISGSHQAITIRIDGFESSLKRLDNELKTAIANLHKAIDRLPDTIKNEVATTVGDSTERIIKAVETAFSSRGIIPEKGKEPSNVQIFVKPPSVNHSGNQPDGGGTG